MDEKERDDGIESVDTLPRTPIGIETPDAIIELPKETDKPLPQVDLLRGQKTDRVDFSLQPEPMENKCEEAREEEKLRNKPVDSSDIVFKHVQHKKIFINRLLLSDLTEDLLVEILSRVPMYSLGSVRSTCKKWNALSRDRIFGKVAEAKNKYVGFITMDCRICTLKMDLQGSCNDGDDFINLSVKQVSVLNEIKVSGAYHCDGLLLCILSDIPTLLEPTLLVWNPYLGESRFIRYIVHSSNMFALGYDNNRNHKILEMYVIYLNRIDELFYGFNIYEFSSDSWKVLDITPKWKIPGYPDSVTLKGNAYFYTEEEEKNMEGALTREHFLLCFDFTSERFGPPLSLPFHSAFDVAAVALSCVKDEQLAVLHQSWQKLEIMEIWITKKINYNEVLWTKWMELDMILINHFSFDGFDGSFFIDEENKIAVIFDVVRNVRYERSLDHTAYIFGQDGYFKSINVGEAEDNLFMRPHLCSSYVPSLVQIE